MMVSAGKAVVSATQKVAVMDARSFIGSVDLGIRLGRG
jgi:hypothetical protein